MNSVAEIVSDRLPEDYVLLTFATWSACFEAHCWVAGAEVGTTVGSTSRGGSRVGSSDARCTCSTYRGSDSHGDDSGPNIAVAAVVTAGAVLTINRSSIGTVATVVYSGIAGALNASRSSRATSQALRQEVCEAIFGE